MVVLCAFLGAACYYDYRYSRIPNWLVCCIGGLGVTGVLYSGNLLMALRYFGVAVFVALVFYPIFRIGCMGAGDVKLFSVCAGFLPGSSFLYFLFFSMAFAAVFSLVHFITQSDAKERFLYLWAYIQQVAGSGKWQLYFQSKEECRRAGICLAGPILASILLHVGGVY